MKHLILLLALALPAAAQTLTNTNLDGVTNATINGKLDDDAAATRTALGLGTAATADTSTVGGIDKIFKSSSTGQWTTGPFVNAGNLLTNQGNIHIPDLQGVRWLKKDGTFSGADIFMMQDHDAYGGEFLMVAPFRIAIAPKGPLQYGRNDSAEGGWKYSTPILLSSGYATATGAGTMMRSAAVGFQTSTWTSGTNTRNYIYAQGVPLDSTGTNSVLRFWDEATVQGEVTGGLAIGNGDVSGNLIAEMHSEGMWTNGTAPTCDTLAAASNIFTQICSKYKTVQVAKFTLGTTNKLALSGLLSGMRGVLYVKQPAAGSKTLALPSGNAIPSTWTAGLADLSTDPFSITRLAWESDGVYTYWTSNKDILPAIDADVTAFADAGRANITDADQKTALNEMVLALKASNVSAAGTLWDKFTAIYPLVGGNATSHSKNLKSTSYDIINDGTAAGLAWQAGTHNSHATGTVAGNGSSVYGNTQLSPADLLQNDVSIYVYSRTPSPTTATCFIGCSGITTRFHMSQVSATLQGYGPNSLNDHYAAISPNSRGHMLSQRTTSTNIQVYFNSTVSSTSSTSLTPESYKFTLFARNRNVGPNEFSNANLGFAAIGKSMTSAEWAAFRTIIDDFQTALGRAN